MVENISVHLTDETNLRLEVGGKTLRFYDTIYGSYVFHKNTRVHRDGHKLYLRSCPINAKTKVPLAGIILDYVFDFNNDYTAFTVSVTVNSKDPVAVGGQRAYLLVFGVEDTKFTKIKGEGPSAEFDVNPLFQPLQFRHSMTLYADDTVIKVKGGIVGYDGSITSHMLAEGDMRLYSEESPMTLAVAVGRDTILPELPMFEVQVITPTNEIVSGDMRLPLNITDDGVTSDGNSLVTLCVKNRTTGDEEYLDTSNDWSKVEFNDSRISLYDDRRSLVLEIRIFTKPEINRIEFETSLYNLSDGYSVLWCQYPEFNYRGRDFDLFEAGGGGEILHDFTRTDRNIYGDYPDGFYFTMSYFALLADCGKSYYVGVHDATGAFKVMYARSAASAKRVRLGIRCNAINFDEGGNTLKLPGRLVWQSFDGDWSDAADIYREFVTTRSDWGQSSAETPEWMQDIPFWVMDWMPNGNPDEDPIPVSINPQKVTTDFEAWYKKVIDLKNALGVPIGYHVYNWHWIPFNNDYPHYLPAKPDFIPGMRKLQEAGVRVMPYINSLLWDTKDRRNSDYRFTKDALPGTAKMEDGTPHIQRYASHEEDGEICKLAVMCPTNRLWRNEIRGVVERLFNEYGVDGVYLDQIGASNPIMCMDRTHNHPTGGGSWWTAAYREFLDEIHTIRPSDKVLTTESNSEVYADKINAFLSWAWVQQTDSVPAFMQIYGDQTIMFGRNAGGKLKPDYLHWKYHLALSLVYGQQLGWINADLYDDPKRLEFLRKLVKFRYDRREFFRYARAVRPPKVEGRAGSFVSYSAMGTQTLRETNWVCVGRLLARDGRTMTIAVNLSDNDVTEVIDGREVFIEAESVVEICE